MNGTGSHALDLRDSNVETIEELIANHPAVHAERSGRRHTYGLAREVLTWLDATLEPGWRTLEIGCGLSTIVFALNRTEHLCITPMRSEGDQVLGWCEERAIPTADVAFEFGFSEFVLPGRDLGDLDFVLIDGSHSFPQVFIDWYFTSLALKVDRQVVIDDTQLWTCRTLRDFLDADPAWRRIHTFQRAVVFTKLAEMNVDTIWTQQPYVVARSRPTWLGRARLRARALLHHLPRRHTRGGSSRARTRS